MINRLRGDWSRGLPPRSPIRGAGAASIRHVGTWNTFIEGDNLDVLATLDPASVDLVYIDPPYNTGNDFAYRDDFRTGAGSGSRAPGTRRGWR